MRNAALCLLCALSGMVVAAPTASGAATDPGTRPVLFVANNWDGTADIVDPTRFNKLARINIIPDKEERLAEIMLDPQRQGYFLAIRELVGEGHDQYADDMFSSPDGRVIYVSRPSFADVVAIDLKTRKIVWRTPVEGQRADHMAISPDGKRLAVSASTARKVHIIDAPSGKIVRSFESGDQPHENNYSRDGSRIFHASIGTVYTPADDPAADSQKGDRYFEVVDAKSLKVLKRVDIGEKLKEAGYPNMSSAVRPMAIDPTERFFYFQISFFHGFVEYDLEKDKVLRLARLPVSEKAKQTPREQYLLDSAHHGLAMNPEGTKLCAAGTMSDYAAIVSRKTFTYKLAAFGEKPYWATNSGDGRYCFVSMSGNDLVSVISYAQEKEIARIPVGDHPQRMRMGHVLVADFGAPPALACQDRLAPRSWFDRRASRLSRTGLILRGRGSDRCGRSAGKLARVLVSVGRLSAHKRCRFVTSAGTLGAMRSCYRPLLHRADGLARWRHALPRSLPAGVYQARSQAVDAAGNAERGVRERTPANLITFRLR